MEYLAKIGAVFSIVVGSVVGLFVHTPVITPTTNTTVQTDASISSTTVQTVTSNDVSAPPQEAPSAVKMITSQSSKSTKGTSGSSVDHFSTLIGMISKHAGLAAEDPYTDSIRSLSATQQQTLVDTIVQTKDAFWAEAMLSKVPNLTTAQHQAMVSTIVQAHDELVSGTALTKVSNLSASDRQSLLTVIANSSNTLLMQTVLMQSANLSQAQSDALVQAIARNNGVLAAQELLAKDKNLTANQRTLLEAIDPSVANPGGATVNSGTQTAVNNGYTTQPMGSVTISGTAASASSVALIVVKSSYTGAQDYYSIPIDAEEGQTLAPLKVSNGSWSDTQSLKSGSYTVLVYDGSSYKLIGTGTVTVVVK